MIAYVEARCRSGLSTDPRTRAILGKHAKAVIATGRWDSATLIEAAERFAASRRHVRWFLDWCATILNERDAKAHVDHKADETGADPLANVNAQLVAAGMKPVTR